MIIQGIFYVIYWIMFFILIGFSIQLVKKSKDDGLSIVFGVLSFLLFLLIMDKQNLVAKPLNEIIEDVRFESLSFIAGGIVLGGLSVLISKHLTNKIVLKLVSSLLIFIALTFGVSLIWMTNIAPYFANALLGLMFTGLVFYLFIKPKL